MAQNDYYLPGMVNTNMSDKQFAKDVLNAHYEKYWSPARLNKYISTEEKLYDFDVMILKISEWLLTKSYMRKHYTINRIEAHNILNLIDESIDWKNVEY